MEILQITIEVSEGHVQTIIVHDNDDPEVLASQFCEVHRLNDNIRQILISQFREKID